MVERIAYSTTTHTSLLKAHLTFKLNKVSLIYSPQIPPLCSYMMSLHLRYIDTFAYMHKLSGHFRETIIALARSIGPLQLAVTWYKIRHAGEQATHWDIQNKENANLS